LYTVIKGERFLPISMKWRGFVSSKTPIDSHVTHPLPTSIGKGKNTLHYKGRGTFRLKGTGDPIPPHNLP
jgi:hypothetical protein